MPTRILVFVAAVASIAACAQRQSSAPVTTSALTHISAGNRGLQVAHFVERADSLRVLAPKSPTDSTLREVGVQWAAEHPSSENGLQTILLAKRSGVGPSLFTDTLVMQRDGLRPIWEHVRYGGGLKDIRFDGSRLHQTTYAHDSIVKSFDREFSTAPFGFNQLELVMRSLPLRVGFRTTLPLYSEGDDSVEVDTVTVLDAQHGPPALWTIRFADPAIVSTYTIDTMTRRVVSYDVTGRKSNASYHMRR